MTYRITIAREAAKTFRKLHPQVAARLKVAIKALADDPCPPGSLQLSGGDGEMRIRVADYRVIYDVIDDELLVLVLRIGPRREVYRRACGRSTGAIATSNFHEYERKRPTKNVRALLDWIADGGDPIFWG